MRGGYAVVNGNGETTPGHRAGGRRALAAGLRPAARPAATGTGCCSAIPTSTALVARRRSRRHRRFRRRRHRRRSTRALPLLVLPTAAAAPTRPPSPRRTASGPGRSCCRRTPPGGPGPLLAGAGRRPDRELQRHRARGRPRSGTRRTAVKIRQRALADSWLAATWRAPPTRRRAEVRLITTAAQAEHAVRRRGSAWIEPMTLPTVLAGKPAEWDEQFAYGSKATDAELSPHLLERYAGSGDSSAPTPTCWSMPTAPTPRPARPCPARPAASGATHAAPSPPTPRPSSRDWTRCCGTRSCSACRRGC